MLRPAFLQMPEMMAYMRHAQVNGCYRLTPEIDGFMLRAFLVGVGLFEPACKKLRLLLPALPLSSRYVAGQAPRCPAMLTKLISRAGRMLSALGRFQDDAR